MELKAHACLLLPIAACARSLSEVPEIGPAAMEEVWGGKGMGPMGPVPSAATQAAVQGASWVVAEPH